MASNPLAQLSTLGQSPWYDQMTRSLVSNGTLKKMIEEDGLRGLTSNPTIFEKAISGSKDYEDALRELVARGAGRDEIYDALVVGDIASAADVFRPVYESTTGADGFVSIEVSPLLAHDTAGTVKEAKRLHDKLARPNVMIKVPGTPEGLPAIEQLISDGISVNVTLIFSVGVYAQIVEAYLKGLEKRLAKGGDLNSVASVASFFVSRIDTAVDKKLDELAKNGCPQAAALTGKTAIANAKLVYEKFQQMFSGARWEKLAAAGARVQRPLWASTGTKNPKYSDVLYIDTLIGPHTVNTMPPITYDAFRDHGKPVVTITDDLKGSRELFEKLQKLGIDLTAVTDELTAAGVKSFAESYNNLISVIERRRQEVAHV
ncbi:MAG: transaldolase [Acidobacteria bacterium]|nr:MAG: transaldolase [Acidobacteriota bacterium]